LWANEARQSLLTHDISQKTNAKNKLTPTVFNMTFSLESLYTWYRDIVANPKYRWWVIGGTLLYVLSPIDIIPDVFPIIGQIDDAVVITLLATELASLLKDRNANMKQKRSDQATAEQSATGESVPAVDVNAVEVG
jgi:uncharacterized membrane protein YkvA (DUF1232 family)